MSVINSNKGRFVTVAGDGNSAINVNKEITDKFDITSEDQMFFGESYFRGIGKVMVYSPGNKNMHWLELMNKGKNINFNKLTDVNNVCGFFIKNLNLRNYHMVYINKLSSIIINQIP